MSITELSTIRSRVQVTWDTRVGSRALHWTEILLTGSYVLQGTLSLWNETSTPQITWSALLLYRGIKSAYAFPSMTDHLLNVKMRPQSLIFPACYAVSFALGPLENIYSRTELFCFQTKNWGLSKTFNLKSQLFENRIFHDALGTHTGSS